MNKVICPVCDGFITTSNRPNLSKHINTRAKSELLDKHLNGSGDTPHADYMKEHFVLKVTTSYVQPTEEQQ